MILQQVNNYYKRLTISQTIYNQAMKTIINSIIIKQQEIETERSKILSQRDHAVMVVYKLRNYIDDQIKKKVPFDTILVEVHKQLKANSPHGKDMVCDS